LHFIFLDGTCQRKKELGKPSHKWENYVNIDFREIHCEDVTDLHWAKTGSDGRHS